VTERKAELASKQITTYQPDRQLHIGFWANWKEMFVELARSRELIWRLFLRTFYAKYKQSLFGVSWAVISPMITVGVFVFLNRSGIMNIETADVPYPVFALLGLTCWVVFSKGLAACTASFVSAGSMIVKINFPRITLVIAAMGEAIVEFLVRIGLTVIVFVIYGIVPSKMTLFFPFLIMPLFFLAWGLGLFLALLAGLFRDTINLVTLLTTYLMFLMPVAYPPPESGILATINQWNPLSLVIISCREMVLYGKISNPNGYIWSTVFCLAFLLFSWRMFHLVETKIPERI
jgi:lipopolysaccharide transport system permease protein